MQLGTLEHAMSEIAKKQAELALSHMLTPAVEGKEPGYLLGLYAGEARGLQLAMQIINEILNPRDSEKKPHGR